MDKAEATNGKRQRIVQAAAKVFDEFGYADATVDNVAAEAGIAKGSVYNYFASKQDLYTAVFTESFVVEESDILDRFERAETATEKLTLLFDNWYQQYGHHKKIGRLVLECWASAARESQALDKGPMAALLQDIYQRWRPMMAGIIEKGQASGEFRPDLESVMAASVIMGTLDGLTLQGILGVGIEVNERFLARLKQGFLAVLGAANLQEETDHATGTTDVANT